MWAQSAAEIGKILTAAREHHHLTQAALGQAIGVSQKWVSQAEQGKETIQLGKVMRALSYLGVRLQTGVTPWSPGHVTPDSTKKISLSDVISANAAPLVRRHSK